MDEEEILCLASSPAADCYQERECDGILHNQVMSVSDLEYHSAGPQLLHSRNSNLEDASERAKSCWQSCVMKQLVMPIDVVRMYNGDRNLDVVTAPQEMDTSFNTSVVCDVHFPLVSIPGNVRNDLESGPEIPATSTPLPPKVNQCHSVNLMLGNVLIWLLKYQTTPFVS